MTTDTTLRNNVRRFYEYVEMPGGYLWGHADTLKTTDLYYNSRYKKGQYDKHGWRKFFYNIVKPACDIASKFVDLDTKDIILIPESESDDNETKVWFMQRKLRQWLKDNQFGVLLNEIGRDYPKYGSVVIRKSKTGKWKGVALVNLRFDPSVLSLTDSDFVIELLEMTGDDIRNSGWEYAEKFTEDGSFTIYMCYHKHGDKWDRYIKTSPFNRTKDGGTIQTPESQINKEDEYLPALELDYKTDVPFPYRELHWEKIPGRWLGLGFVEYLFDNQIATNETENLERKGLAHTALKVYQTRDEMIGGSNVLTGIENGAIIKVESEITPIQNEERNLAAFNNTRNRWDQGTERKTFTTDITTGANLPSRTPLGVANLQAQLATSFFELKREQFGLFLKELILADIIPDFKEGSMKAHVLTFSGSDDELERLDRVIIRSRTDRAVEKYIARTSYAPSKLQRKDLEERITEDIERSMNRFVNVPDEFYANARYLLDVLVTGESRDVGAMDSISQFVLQALIANPGILQNRTSRTILFKMMSGHGVSPAELNLISEDVDTTPVQAGGSAARPTPMPQGGRQFSAV
jgi:hypothetical protein